VGVVERSIEEFESVGAAHVSGAGALSDPDLPVAELPVATNLRPEDIAGICASANPLREEPHPLVVGAVKRFGVVGLIGCAVGAGFTRWWRSRTR